MKSKKGFTLLELIISIAILAIIIIGFSGMFTSGIGILSRAGKRSGADFEVQQALETRLSNPSSGTEGSVVTNVEELTGGMKITFGGKTIEVPGKLVTSEYNDGKIWTRVITFVSH